MLDPLTYWLHLQKRMSNTDIAGVEVMSERSCCASGLVWECMISLVMWENLRLLGTKFVISALRAVYCSANLKNIY